jgi:hypothetical protein
LVCEGGIAEKMKLKDRIYEVLIVVRNLSETKSVKRDVVEVGTERERIMEIFEEELSEYRSREWMPTGVSLK